MARFFYFYKSGQIILSLLCIIFLSAVNELCRTEQVDLLQKSYVKRAAPLEAPEFNSTLDTLMDAAIDDVNATKISIDAATIDLTTPPSLVIKDTRTSPSSITNNLIAVPPSLIDDSQAPPSLFVNRATRLSPSLSIINNLTTTIPPPSNSDDDSQAPPSLVINDTQTSPSSLLFNVTTLSPSLIIKNSTVTPPSVFVNDSRTLLYRTYCISVPFFSRTNFLNSLHRNDSSLPDGTYPIYAQKLSSRYLPIISLFIFIIYSIIRMLCLYARPYSNKAGRHRRCCQCSIYVHAFFSLLILGLGFAPLLYAHHRWNNISAWPHINAMVEFPPFWLFAEAIFLLLMLTVAFELGLRDCLYAVIRLDRTNFGYQLPPCQGADSTILSRHSSVTPLQPLRNYFDDAQQEANEMEMTITEIANQHRCYGSRRYATAPSKPTFNHPLPSSDIGVNESSSSTNNTNSNCACSTFKHSPTDDV